MTVVASDRVEVVRLHGGADTPLECWCPDSYRANGVAWAQCPEHVLGELRVPRPESVW